MGLHVGDPSRPRINVTPLVDIVLVLLIIFIVITPAVEAKVQLPKARHSPQAGKEKPLLLTLQPDGWVKAEDPHVRQRSRLLPLEADPERWAELGSLEGCSILIHADAQRPYRDIQKLLDRIRSCGAREARFATRQGREGGVS